MGYKGSNWSDAEVGNVPPSKEEVAGDMRREYQKDDRDLEELREDYEELDEEVNKSRIKQSARKETADDIIEMVEELPEKAEEAADGPHTDKEKDWERAVQLLVRDLKGKYTRRYGGPTKKEEKLHKLKSLIAGGEMVEEDKDIEEVF